ncbi:squalene/phytoene synthase family protein [Magnetospirillum sulfuroxidans]|uniref:Squalene/phytoene synthase family protein n=1 Tax=Magnetospirillum sulfuroxidans TaxID=611300 RepID=A0ABS5I8R3_9PROT|nr:squalene/phytoene synthase family protein [Magnetospirillum sulfuroxidans]MBR9970651.1 squalene/phytoene synthase family protein [Magnetospirillum sulfuroxidans]
MARAVAVPLPASAGKHAGDENFPVASLLLSPTLRPQVLAFYRFARAADDIADNPALDGEDKLMQLDDFDRGLGGLSGAQPALDLHAALGGNSRLLGHAATLLHAFRRDAMVNHCRSWSDLMAYCACSAAPVGRFLLDLHHQPVNLHARADCLCCALQILNHLQDCGDDYRTLDRVYLPADWLAASGFPLSQLAQDKGGAALRHVIDLMLDRVEMLIDQAAGLPAAMTDRRLAMETAVTIEVAQRLAALLRRHDPLTRRVRLSPLAYAGALVRGVIKGLRPTA